MVRFGMATGTNDPLHDSFGRQITYLRLSVTDRCDLRCGYCMSETMAFLPKADVLLLEELATISEAFVRRGVRRIRITGGEPLVRRDIMTLIARLGAMIHSGARSDVRSGTLDEVTLTTNGTQLSRHADALAAAGVRRINVSLDTLDDRTFTQLTRRAVLSDVLAGIDAAQRAGLTVKINTVALKGINIDEIPAIIEWAHGRSMTLTLIEVMPMGEGMHANHAYFYPLTEMKDRLSTRWSLAPLPTRTGGPARYMRVRETGGQIGFITPLTENFCAGCNRVRVTCTGSLYGCLGHGQKVDLRAALRGPSPEIALEEAFAAAMIAKPDRHRFEAAREQHQPAVARHMSVTGG
ncbi:MAG: GTP 3',8-cyclase MoaA [Pseudomonadota bacterium]